MHIGTEIQIEWVGEAFAASQNAMDRMRLTVQPGSGPPDGPIWSDQERRIRSTVYTETYNRDYELKLRIGIDPLQKQRIKNKGLCQRAVTAIQTDSRFLGW